MANRHEGVDGMIPMLRQLIIPVHDSVEDFNFNAMLV
ncbi:MAG: hypothetical protein ETSY1_42405 [Candidatus Entotheonella factor]|uniref:Uncharacterized protein n=1 Tax=Entotheonella factor TaxID=1429438 RepID=W4L5W8_ENTF1|nr:MAG: hypothetical protein ETSY1_42405 [Candidatus Entotheonella factor]